MYLVLVINGDKQKQRIFSSFSKKEGKYGYIKKFWFYFFLILWVFQHLFILRVLFPPCLLRFIFMTLPCQHLWTLRSSKRSLLFLFPGPLFFSILSNVLLFFCSLLDSLPLSSWSALQYVQIIRLIFLSHFASQVTVYVREWLSVAQRMWFKVLCLAFSSSHYLSPILPISNMCVFSTPTSNAQTPAGSPTSQLNSDTIYLETGPDPTG